MASGVRQQSRRQVLDVLLDWLDEGVTQADLESATGLSRGKVAAALDDLQPILRPENGSVALAPSRGGRRAKLFYLRSGIGGIGIDFGRSHVRVGVQRLSRHEPRPDDVSGRQDLDFDVAEQPERALDLAIELLEPLLSRRRAPSTIAGICVGLAAPVAKDGRVRAGPFQAWMDLDHCSEIMARLDDNRISGDTHVMVDNDANLALRAEMRWGAALEAGTAVYVKWATGIGSAVCVDGRVVRGTGGIAGELGHTAIPEPGPELCGWCGRHCLESVASLKALRPDARREEIAAIAADRDHPAHDELRRDIDRAGTLIGRTVAPVVSAINPEVVIVGGLGPESFPALCVPPIAEAIEGSVPPSVARDLRVKAGEQTNRASITGALAAVFVELVPERLLALL